MIPHTFQNVVSIVHKVQDQQNVTSGPDIDRARSASNKVLLGHSHTHSIACICGYMALYLQTAVFTGTFWPTESVKVNPDCQLDGIYNHRGNNTLSMSRRNFIDWGNG